MKVLLFGATGMVGQGVLLECLRDERVDQVLAVGRTATGRQHAKLREIVRADLFDLDDVRDDLAGSDACFFCLGVSATGMRQADYRRITYDLTLSVARLLGDVTFCYVSGQGTGELGRLMWARVKGATENALLALPLRAVMFRPGFIQPMDGVTSKTRLYATAYRWTAPLLPLLRRVFPRFVTTTRAVGRAMIAVAAEGSPKPILETRDINELGE